MFDFLAKAYFNLSKCDSQVILFIMDNAVPFLIRLGSNPLKNKDLVNLFE